MMNILLTGGCGYIGTNLTNKLINLGHQVTVVDIMWFGNYLISNCYFNYIFWYSSFDLWSA